MKEIISAALSNCVLVDSPGFGNAGDSNTPQNSQGAGLTVDDLLKSFESEPQGELVVINERVVPSIDTATYMVPIQSEQDVKEIIHNLIESIGNDSVAYYPGRGRTPAKGNYHENSAYSTRGCVITYALPNKENQKGEMRIHLTGKFFMPLNLYERAAINLELLLTYNAKCTRIDLTFDDTEKYLSLDKIIQARRDRNYTRFHQSKYHESTSDFGEGICITFGSGKSQNCLRVYDKTVESKGKIQANRWERQMRSSIAHEHAKLLSECGYDEELIKTFIVQTVVAATDFIDRSQGDKNLERCPRLPWWQDFLSFLETEPLRLIPNKPQRCFSKSREWIEKQVQTTLAMIHEVYGERQFREFIDKQVKEGVDRFSDYHRAEMDLAKRLFRTPQPLATIL